MSDGFVTVNETGLVPHSMTVTDALQSVDERLAFIEALCKRIVVQTNIRKETTEMKSWHIGLIVALIVAYLVGVKYPSIGASALGKVGL